MMTRMPDAEAGPPLLIVCDPPTRSHAGLPTKKRCRPFTFSAILLISVLLLSHPLAAAGPRLKGPGKPHPATAAPKEPSANAAGIWEEIAAAPVHFYQHFIGPHLGRSCAYHPSCSNYALQAIRKHGALLGTVMTFDRLQHEADEARHAPPIRIGSEIRFYDPLERNDDWWYGGTSGAGK